MKSIFYVASLTLFVGLTFIFGWHGKYENEVKLYNHAGLVGNALKMWADTVTVTGALQSVDISSAGFTTVLAADVIAEFNSTNPLVLPIAAVKTYTITAVVVNLMQSTTQTVVLAGTINGLEALQAFSSTRVHVKVIGY